MSIWRDLIHAVRSLANARAFTIVCVMTLGIGMTPVIAIQFGMRMFTTPPRGVNTETLVEIVTTRVGSRGATDRWSYPDFHALRAAATGVSMIGWAMGVSPVTLPASGEVKNLRTMFVSPGYFETIGVALARGPGFQETADPVVILGYTFWQQHLASDPDILGKTLTVNRVSHIVAGIAPDRFRGHLVFEELDLFLPLERYPVLLADSNARFDRNREWVRIHGRLSPGVSVAQANAAVSTFTSQLAQAYPASNESKAGIVAPYHTIGNIEGEDLHIVFTLWNVMTVIPLVVVCLNVSGMMQVRSAMRERELSIRQAIGASRGRLIQYLLAEAVVLAALGCLLAAIVLFNLPPLVSWWVGEPIPPLFQEVLRIDFFMLATCAGLSLATSLVFGWLPALRFSRPVIMTVLKDEAGTGGLRAGRAHRVTSGLQVAIAVPLLVLSFVSLDRMRTTATADLGFEADLLYAAPLELDAAAGEIGFQIRKVRDSLAKTSGVAAVTVADGLPLDFRYRIARVSTQTDANAAPKIVSAHVTRVGDGYLDTMGIALLRGRRFTIDDAAGSELVTIVSKALSDTLFPGSDAIGQRITFGSPDNQEGPQKTLTIVGVSEDFPTSQMGTDREQFLLPLAQHQDVRRDSVPVSDDRQNRPTLMLVARSALGEPPLKLTAALENAIREIDTDFNAASVVTGVQLRQNSINDYLTQVGVTGISGGVSLLLAALGIYGVVGLMVSTRTREIAVRVTLGASRLRVTGMILFDVVKLVAPGVIVGLLLTAVLTRLNGGLSLSTIEPLAYVAGAAIAILAAVLAGLAPARRAASVEPMVAMRST